MPSDLIRPADVARMTSVIWVGRVCEAAQAVACGTCNVTIGQPCQEWTWDKLTQPLSRILDRPHKSRSDYAHVLGFRDVAGAGPLFEVVDG